MASSNDGVVGGPTAAGQDRVDGCRAHARVSTRLDSLPRIRRRPPNVGVRTTDDHRPEHCGVHDDPARCLGPASPIRGHCWRSTARGPPHGPCRRHPECRPDSCWIPLEQSWERRRKWAASFTVTVSNATGIVSARTYTLNISGVFIQDDTILPTAIVGTPSMRTLTATAGAGTVLWSAPSMPPGLILSPNGAITGPPTSSGIFTFVATANDGVKAISRQFTIQIRQPIPSVLDIFLGGTNLSDVVLGSNVTLFLNAANGVPPYTWRLASGSTLPPGLQLVILRRQISASSPPRPSSPGSQPRPAHIAST